MNEIMETPEYYDIIPEYNSEGRLCNYHTGEGETVRVMADEWERFNQLAGRQHEVVDGIVVYNEDLEQCLPDDADKPKDLKLSEVSEACTSAIYMGCDVTLTDGTNEHFSLEETDQINLSNAVMAVSQGVEGYPYHADGQLCRIYSASDINLIASAATVHKLYHTTYCNHLNYWISRAALNELGNITYGVALPDDLNANMETILNATNV